ncbi:hypothetical protein K2Z83_04645 [Oscillochloris sp. ZM17-4]|uniref:hypothetical protein n=1 Tax=Oscillochloris sp. ZM17-4 TaxID=2866714 RepID=UPI001C7392B6|nr:hypothetical protein [Oscillochloris sp. ZM17-4]MBX0326969.1 hypothetical protein [Oscillochloris sp. ZM17-4]
MLSQLPAYLSAVAGDALNYELLLIITFTLLLDIRRLLQRGLRWYRTQSQMPEDRLRAALWKLLRGQ